MRKRTRREVERKREEDRPKERWCIRWGDGERMPGRREGGRGKGIKQSKEA